MKMEYQIKIIRKRLQSLTVMLLVLVYVAVHIEFEAIHHELHKGEEITHTVADEQDLCHVSIYHGSDKPGCHHKAHFTAAKTCPLCHVYSSTEKITSTNTFVVKDISHQETSSKYSCPDFIEHTFDVPSRGPPAIA